MQVDAECNGPVWASVNDQRVTRLGRLLRSTHLDELPQFFNVLRREMSLIGPRPERPAFVRLLSRAIPYFDRRHLVRPGVTGWAVIRFGYSDSVRDKWIIHEYDLYLQAPLPAPRPGDHRAHGAGDAHQEGTVSSKVGHRPGGPAATCRGGSPAGPSWPWAATACRS